ncbi:MAG TPA: PAC2 family protein [Ktedonobacteraceae bacterium]|nr:PAC2 family protein [Ktedonobacteraceae bacterium]
MTYVQYHAEPELRNPVLVAAFGGWNDAADAATAAVKILSDRWHTVKLADIEPEDFFVFTETRPIVRYVDGIERSITWPVSQFSAHQSPFMNRDIILFQGSEPQLKWKTYTKQFLAICKHYKVTEVVLLGALLADIPHSITVPISGTASNGDLRERLQDMDVHHSRYEGPTGIVGVLQDACRRAGIPAASIWAAAPHYLAATPNIKVTAALLTYLNVFLSLGLDLSEIQSEAIRFEEQISALVARDPEASAYVQKLEEQVAGLEEDEDEDETGELEFNPDKAAGTGPLPSADTLIRGVEELLRQQRENNQHKNDSDEDDR